ncbi:hypothetical protein CEXT_789531 [Caerostris extrusa]|uniref:Uncharacterized protein n=1 Tax=Caerostris extrusa TaxID=172846 RepID=A0AAV4M738_CAEEX|nr:hypothetical protein CEXT_789531 [Caerostris extrusa]
MQSGWRISEKLVFPPNDMAIKISRPLLGEQSIPSLISIKDPIVLHKTHFVTPISFSFKCQMDQKEAPFVSEHMFSEVFDPPLQFLLFLASGKAAFAEQPHSRRKAFALSAFHPNKHQVFIFCL